ncbi:MAG: DUF1194 domain-containing protein [Opitutales bacterium]
MNALKRICGLLTLPLLPAAASAAFISSLPTAPTVDGALLLLNDVSGSISTSEYNLVTQGYQAAFSDPTIQNRFNNGSIAVQVIQWDTSSDVSQDWFLIDSPAAAQQFANIIGSDTRLGFGGTSPDQAISFAAGQASSAINNGLFNTDTFIIDIFSDGSGSGFSTRAARDAALDGPIDTINAITVGSSSVNNFYANNAIGGDGAFAVQANSFSDFADVVTDKIDLETSVVINPVPEPSVYLGGITALGLLFAIQRKQKAKRAS